MDVGDWLRGLGLERYEQAFRDNEIDAELLPKLTADDLKDLGVALVGHRRRLLEAIAALKAPEHEEAKPATGEPSPSAPPSRPEAERRQLTVLFCDLVGSTALSAQLDPEDMRDVIRTYQNAVAGEIGRLEGHIAKFMGDGVLAYFGWPRAHEDEAERAVRASLALAQAIGRLETPTGEALAARVGIATGLVVVGDLVGEGAAQEEAVVGETPNLAARLQGLAEPGQIVIAEGTRRLLGDLFDLADLGAQRVRGIAEPAGAFVVLGERPLQSRFEAHSGPALRPMVGRDQELALLLERWAQAKSGEGQGVLLVGEAGIGKSRISRALLDALAEEAHFRVRYQCSPYHTDSALWPVIQQLNHAAGLDAEDPLEARLDQLEALLDRANGRDAAPLIADLIGLDGAGRYGKLDFTPESQRTRTLDALVHQLLGLAARQPVLLILEDAHWIDPTTLELIEQCLDLISDARVLLLLTSRPDHQPELAAHPHVTRFTLNRLGRAGVEAIVARLGGDHLPIETIDAIIARTDGVPLFVEELTKAILETGEITIPASLYDSLMARLDRIPEVKEVAQVAACIGREFDYALLAAVVDRSDPDLRSALDKLAAAELIFRRGRPPEATYTFKHSLVQDAAYQSLLRRRRQDFHFRTGRALEQRFPERAASEPELLAHHYAEAGRASDAVTYLQHAGEKAVRRSANREAIGHLTRGLELLVTLPDTAERAERELRLQSTLGPAVMATKGYASPEVATIYARARELAQTVGQTHDICPVLFGVWLFQVVRGDLRAAREVAEELLELAERVKDNLAPRMFGHSALAVSLLHMGVPASARGHFEQALALYDFESHHGLAFRYGFEVGIMATAYHAWSLWLLGHPDRALLCGTRALALVGQVGHSFTGARALYFNAILHHFRREATTLRHRADQALISAREHGFALVLAVATILQGAALAARERSADGAKLVREGLEAYRATGAEFQNTHHLVLLAEALGAAGSPEEGLDALAEAEALAEKFDERYCEAEIHRLRGELLLAQAPNDWAAAEASFRQALDVARRQQAKSLELRAATSLAHLWADQGEREQARDLLAPVYDWFTEGFDTADLKDAKALLDQLR